MKNKIIFYVMCCAMFSVSSVASAQPTFAKIDITSPLSEYVQPKCDIYVTRGHSIQKALDAAAPSSSICVGPGVYNEKDFRIFGNLSLFGNHSTVNIRGSFQTVCPKLVEGFTFNNKNKDIVVDMRQALTHRRFPILSACSSLFKYNTFNY